MALRSLACGSATGPTSPMCARYGLGEIAPICGDSPRLPIDPHKLK
jgi:hypothetical protein